MKILFRADGSLTLGMGHIVRSTALAEEFMRRGHDVLFVVKENEQAKKMIDQRNISRLDYVEDHITFMDLLITNKIDIFVSDVVEYKSDFFIRLKKEGIYSVQLDILRDLNLGVDLLINGGIYAKEMSAEAMKQGQKALLGSKYNLLRKEFSKARPKEYRKEVQDVLITMGATDVHNLTEKLTFDALKIFDSARIHVVVGNDKKIFDGGAFSDSSKVNLYYQTPYMLQLMEKADIALCSGGMTLYELAACGTPSIVITQADNQVRQTETFASYGATLYYGRAEDYDGRDYKKILERVKSLTLRSDLSRNARKHVDGRGVERVVDYLVDELAQ